MRIISGKFRGKKFEAPRNYRGRPTTDYARESLFNILSNHFDFEEISVLDLFSGTGAFSYECFSRGCENITAVELDGSAMKFIEKNFREMEMVKCTVIKADAFRYLEKCQRTFDLILADPPFDHDRISGIPRLVNKHGLLNPEGMLVLEHSADHSFKGTDGFFEERRYGAVHFSFFRNSAP